MSEHVKLDTATAQPAEHINAALAEIQRELNVRDERISNLEKRLDDQEYSVRRVLDMLIEWFETDHQGNDPASSEA